MGSNKFVKYFNSKKYEDLIIESVGVIGRLGLLASGCPRMRGKLELFGFKFSNFILRMWLSKCSCF